MCYYIAESILLFFGRENGREKRMGFFSDLKDAWNSGNGIVTRTVEGVNREVGRKKAQTIAEMRAKGYELVNEIAEEGTIDSMFGANAATRYTLTFQYSEALAAQVQREQEAQRKAEAERARREAEERKRLQKEEDRRRKEEEQKTQRRSALKEELREALGHGWSISLSGEKENRKAAVAATNALLAKDYYLLARKQCLKELSKQLKKFGSALVMNDFGASACRKMCEKLQRKGVKASVVQYDEEAVFEQQVTKKYNGLAEGAYNIYIDNMLFNIAYSRIDTNKANATEKLYEELLAAQKTGEQGVSKE